MLERGCGKQRRQLLHRRVCRHDHLGLVAIARLRQERGPVEARRKGVELGDLHEVVHAHGIALLGGRPLQRGDRRLQRQDAVGAATRLVDAGPLEGVFDIVAIGRAMADERLARQH